MTVGKNKIEQDQSCQGQKIAVTKVSEINLADHDS